jgi:hypothetical protein
MVMVIPSTSQPASFKRCAVTELSTPPLIITAICLSGGPLGSQAKKLGGINFMFHSAKVITNSKSQFSSQSTAISNENQHRDLSTRRYVKRKKLHLSFALKGQYITAQGKPEGRHPGKW